MVNLTPYSGVIFGGVILTPKRSLKNSFSGVKMTPDIKELKYPQKGVNVYLKFVLHFQS